MGKFMPNATGYKSEYVFSTPPKYKEQNGEKTMNRYCLSFASIEGSQLVLLKLN